MSDEKYYTWIAALTIGAGLSLILIIFGTLPRGNPEPSIKIQKWYDIEEEVICYYANPDDRWAISISCVRGKEWEE